MRKRDIVLAISGIAFILFVVFLSLLLGEHLKQPSCGCPKMVSQNFVILFIVLAIIFVGGIIYYLLSLQLEKQEEKIEFNLNTVLKFLDEDEKDILEQIRDEDGEMLQSKIGMDKVRKHRAIKKLKEKNIIKSRKHGRTNKLTLNEKFRLE